MSIQKQTVKFAFGAARQEKGAKHLQINELVAATNVRQTDEGPYTKRRGYTRTVPTVDTGAWTAPAESLTCGDGDTLLARDGDNRMWAYDSPSNVYRDRGKLTRFMPRHEVVQTDLLSTPRSVALEVGANTWIFTSGASPAANNHSFQVADTTTGIVKARGATVVGTAAVQLAAVFDGTDIWLFYVDGTNVIRAQKYSPTTFAAVGGPTTYLTGAATRQWITIDAHRLSSISETAVVATGFDSAVTTTSFRTHSYLDPATGAARVAPAPVETSTTTTPKHAHASILISTGSGGSWFYSFWRANSPSSVSSSLILNTINATTLAVTSSTVLVTTASTGARAFSVSSGFVAANGDRIVFGQMDPTGGTVSTIRPDLYVVTRYTFDGSTVVAFDVARGSWLASKPAFVGSVAYFLTGFDDPAVAPVTLAGLQRTLHLRDSNGAIHAQIIYGNGPASYHRNTPAIDLTTDAALRDCFVTPLSSIAINTAMVFATGTQASTDDRLFVTRVIINTDETFGKPVSFAGKAIAPGAIPVVWSRADDFHEVSPLLFPHYIRRTAGAGAGVVSIAAVYRMTDADGTIWRSAPIIVNGTFGNGDTIEVPALRHRLTPNREIEFYASTGTSLQLQKVEQGNVVGDAVTFTLTTPLKVGETLYTTGGALSAAPPPPTKAVGAWRNRIFFASGSDLWFSQEISEGFGPILNEVLRARISDGTGDITVLGPIDWNYLAVFKRDLVAAISGAGPDGRGAGNYTAQTLTTKMGCTATGSVTSGPAGCFFQDSTTSLVACATPSLQAVEAAGGFEDSAAVIPITAAMHVETERQMQFFNPLGVVMVIDYGHPTEAAPFGLCYTWLSAGLAAGLGACVDASGPVHIESTGILRRPGSAFQDATATTPADILMSLNLGRLQPDGMQGEFAVSRVQALMTFFSAHDIRITTFPDDAVVGTPVTKTITAAPDQTGTRPPNCGRINNLRVLLEELASTGRGFDFEGLAVEFQVRGRAKVLNTSQMV